MAHCGFGPCTKVSLDSSSKNHLNRRTAPSKPCLSSALRTRRVFNTFLRLRLSCCRSLLLAQAGMGRETHERLLAPLPREKTVLLERLGESEEAALPGWLYKVLKKQYPDHLDSLAAAGRHKPPLTLRVNSQKSSRYDYLKALSSAGIEAIPVGAYGLTLPWAVPVSQIPGFSEGVASVQDESAQLAGTLIAGTSAGAGAPLGIRVLDVCSAPGSKACHLAELGAEVTAMDVSASRLARVEENAERLGLTIKTLVGDGREPADIAEENVFDLVLLDVPCSATGVMRRNPDVKSSA